MTLADKIAAMLFKAKPRAVARLPVPALLRATPYTPTPAPVITPNPVDAEVMLLWSIYVDNTAALIPRLTATARELDDEMAQLKAELTRLQAQPRFTP